MIINLKVTQESGEPQWSNDRYACHDDCFCLSAHSSDELQTINFVKGAVLHALGEWEHPPDEIKFNIIKSTLIPRD
jgi:hypothetical protein